MIMKKLFTSIVIALCAMSVNAQETITLYHPTTDKVNPLTGDALNENGAEGWSVTCMKDEKTLDQAAAITIDGNTYRSIKVSNGAQTKVTLPTGKIATKVTIYSYVNKDAATTRPCFWKEVNGTEYTSETAKIMTSYKDGANPDVNTYELGGVSEFTFTNAGEQPCLVLVVEFKEGTPSGISSIEIKANENAPIYNLNGQKVSKDYKGVVVKNGKKYIQK